MLLQHFRKPRSNFNPRNLLYSGFLHNVIALYGVQACTYALPLLTFPYLARVLGPSGWGWWCLPRRSAL
jgi:hypothetical protein